MNFSLMDFAPRTRYLYYESPNRYLVTAGEGTYIVNSNIDVAENDEHILIGRYCSIAQQTNFMIGRNHDYRRVTTYPMNDARYLSHINKLPPPPEKIC